MKPRCGLPAATWRAVEFSLPFNVFFLANQSNLARCETPPSPRLPRPYVTVNDCWGVLFAGLPIASRTRCTDRPPSSPGAASSSRRRAFSSSGRTTVRSVFSSVPFPIRNDPSLAFPLACCCRFQQRITSACRLKPRAFLFLVRTNSKAPESWSGRDCPTALPFFPIVSDGWS